MWTKLYFTCRFIYIFLLSLTIQEQNSSEGAKNTNYVEYHNPIIYGCLDVLIFCSYCSWWKYFKVVREGKGGEGRGIYDKKDGIKYHRLKRKVQCTSCLDMANITRIKFEVQYREIPQNYIIITTKDWKVL